MIKKTALLLPTLLIFLPFLLLCLYNQPTGDDLWYTWMAKRYGIAGAQYQWFITINGRYSASFFMSLNSWVHGSTISFKIWPAVVMLSWVGVVAAVIQRITSKAISSFYCLFVSLLLVGCYYLCMPDIQEGAYWMAAVTGYQIPLLLYLCCWLLLFNSTANGKWKQIVLLPLLLVITGGFHELIAGMAFMLCIYLAVIRRFLYKMPFAKWLRAALILLIPILIQVLCIGNQYKASLITGKRPLPFLRIVRISVVQTGTHLAEGCLLSPAFWLMLIVAWYIACRYLRSNWVLRQPLHINLLVVSFLTLFLTFLPGLVNVFLEKELAPLRIINLSVFVFIAGCMAGVGLYGIQGPAYGWLSKAAVSVKYSYLLLLVAILFGAAVLSNNERAVVQALADGSAKEFDRESQQRFQKLESCKTDTCIFSCLKHPPPDVWPDDICRHTHPLQHLSKVYNKTLVVKSE